MEKRKEGRTSEGEGKEIMERWMNKRNGRLKFMMERCGRGARED